MLPPLTADSVLPLGVHLAPVTEIITRFGGHNAVRRDMPQRLQRILALAHGTGQLRRAFVWGSFVPVKPEPADIDLMFVMSADFRSEQCPPSVRQVFDGEAAEHVLGVRSCGPERTYQAVSWTPFWSSVRSTEVAGGAVLWRCYNDDQ